MKNFSATLLRILFIVGAIVFSGIFFINFLPPVPSVTTPFQGTFSDSPKINLTAESASGIVTLSNLAIFPDFRYRNPQDHNQGTMSPRFLTGFLLQGKLYLPSKSGWLEIDPNSKNQTFYPAPFSISEIYNLQKIYDQYVLISTAGPANTDSPHAGIWKFEPLIGFSKIFAQQEITDDKLASLAFYYDSSSNIYWIGSYNKILSYNPINGFRDYTATVKAQFKLKNPWFFVVSGNSNNVFFGMRDDDRSGDEVGQQILEFDVTSQNWQLWKPSLPNVDNINSNQNNFIETCPLRLEYSTPHFFQAPDIFLTLLVDGCSGFRPHFIKKDIFSGTVQEISLAGTNIEQNGNVIFPVLEYDGNFFRTMDNQFYNIVENQIFKKFQVAAELAFAAYDVANAQIYFVDKENLQKYDFGTNQLLDSIPLPQNFFPNEMEILSTDQKQNVLLTKINAPNFERRLLLFDITNRQFKELPQATQKGAIHGGQLQVIYFQNSFFIISNFQSDYSGEKGTIGVWRYIPDTNFFKEITPLAAAEKKLVYRLKIASDNVYLMTLPEINETNSLEAAWYTWNSAAQSFQKIATTNDSDLTRKILQKHTELAPLTSQLIENFWISNFSSAILNELKSHLNEIRPSENELISPRTQVYFLDAKILIRTHDSVIILEKSAQSP